jgi:hypothetical protein
MDALFSALPYPGNLGHTAFATSCTSGSNNCIAPTADPGGAWLRGEPAAPRAPATSPSGLDTPRQRHESQRRAASRRSASLGQLTEIAGPPYQPMYRPCSPHRRVDAQHARPLPRRGHRRVRLAALPTLSLSLALALPLILTLVPIPCPS